MMLGDEDPRPRPAGSEDQAEETHAAEEGDPRPPRRLRVPLFGPAPQEEEDPFDPAGHAD